MRVLFRLALCSTLLTWCAMAQRGGHSGGFGHGGVSLGSRGGGFSGARGGFGGLSSGFRGYNGYRGSGYRYYRGGYGFGFGGYGYGPYYGYGYYPWTGYGYSYWPSYSDNYSDSYYPDTYGYSPYNPSPNVTVVYPPAQAARQWFITPGPRIRSDTRMTNTVRRSSRRVQAPKPVRRSI